jgi:hypothetical protein
MFAGKLNTNVLMFAIFIISILGGGQAYAQVSGATVSGMVTDASGAAIPQAQVVITNVSTRVARNMTTDSAGFYTAPNLLPGTYEVRITATGFSTQVRMGITVTVGAQQALLPSPQPSGAWPWSPCPAGSTQAGRR